MLLAAHWIIVEATRTDNIVELLHAGGGLRASLALAGWLATLALAANQLATTLAEPSGRRRRWAGWICAIASVPLGYALLRAGLESDIYKYGRHYSALQFLLGPNRDDLLTPAQLFTRYVIVHGAALVALGYLSLPLWKVLLRRAAPASPGNMRAIRR